MEAYFLGMHDQAACTLHGFVCRYAQYVSTYVRKKLINLEIN